MNKKKFLKEEYTVLLSSLTPDQKGKWGKMNAQQMVEHMSQAVEQASAGYKEKPVLTSEQTQKAYAFMMTEKPFRENTPNQLLPDEPIPFKHVSMKAAIAGLQKEIDYFFTVFSENTELRHLNPFFGNLNFEEQVHLLHKHATHHLRQFGLAE